MKIIIMTIGGLAIFLYGMELMSKDLSNAAGSKIKDILNKFTKNRFYSFLTGVVTTTIIQSSSAVSVMAVSLVEAKLLQFAQTFGILLGAGIGTTVTAHIIAFKITDYSLLFIAAGFAMKAIPAKQSVKFIGGALLGFGLLFFGLQLMSEAMYPLRTYQPFLNIIGQLNNPVLGIFVGIVFTAIIQSSSAFIGIVIVMASQGIINLEIAIPLLLGSNIGTTTTAIIASLQSGIEAKRVAVAFLSIKLIGVILICWWLATYENLVYSFTSYVASDQASIMRQIANAHTLFNVFATIIIFPFYNKFTEIIIKMMPDKNVKSTKSIELQHIKKIMLKQPDIALALAKQETSEMGKVVYSMIESSFIPFLNKKSQISNTIAENEKYVDFYQEEISSYVTQISRQDASEDIIKDSFKVMYIVSELEEIADISYNVLMPKSMIWVTKEVDFSESGKKEIEDFYKNIMNYFSQTLELFNAFNSKSAKKLKRENKNLRKLAVEIKYNHFMRLSGNIEESIRTSENHMEIVAALKTIQSHIANIIRILND